MYRVVVWNGVKSPSIQYEMKFPKLSNKHKKELKSIEKPMKKSVFVKRVKIDFFSCQELTSV